MFQKYLPISLLLTVLLIGFQFAPNQSVAASNSPTAGITIVPSSTQTTESGGNVTLSISLVDMPTHGVTINFSSTNTDEGTLSTAARTFSASNWTPTINVTVSGIDDNIDDGDVPYDITFSVTSNDPSYNGLVVPPLNLTNIDDDVSEFEVSAVTGTINESGSTASFTLALGAEPSAPVSINISSSDISEGIVSPSSVSFTASDWDTPQTVTVTSVDDAVQDGDIDFDIILAAASSGDPQYNGVDPADITLTNIDNDVVGITIAPTSGLNTDESGTSDTFTIVLDSEPTANVAIPLSSSDTTEGTVAPSLVLFTIANWNTPQTVTVMGLDDLVADGPINYSIITGAASSQDSNYNGLNADDVSVTNADNDVAGITVTPTSGLTTEEGGTTATFTIVLDTMPTANVAISLSSSDTTEGTTAPSPVLFTIANWNTPQTVTITGVDDFVVDGPISYNIVTAPASSQDSNYSGLNADDVSVTNIDDDVAGITVTPTSGLTTEEDGTSATFTIVLDTMPSANVAISLSSNDTSEGTVAPSLVLFTIANWNSPQTITVSGVDDFVDDGPIGYSIITDPASSADSNYSGLNADDVSVTNIDNDVAGISVTPTSGLTTEEDGTAATFTIVLDTMPTANVAVSLSSNDPSEGTVVASPVLFTIANWNNPQTVTVTGVDDFVDDGNISYSIITAPASSADGNYSGLNAADVSISNIDDDDPGFIVSPLSLSTNEDGASATFTMRLTSEPTANVAVGISSGDASEGTVSTASLNFTAANWNSAQSVTVTGVDDAVADGAITYDVVTAPASSADPSYNSLNPTNVSVTNQDDDTPGATVNPLSGLTTGEDGTSAAFTVRLNTQPLSSVSIPVSSNDVTEGQITITSLTFTTSNWNVTQQVQVNGIDDDVDDDNQNYTIVLGTTSSNDPNYNGSAVDPADVSITNVDNDIAGVTVGAISGDTDEGGSTATFTVVLDSQPTSNVTIGVSSSDVGEGTVSPSSLIFTASNWNTPKTVTVTGVDDGLDIDGDQTFTVSLANATSSDGKYNDKFQTDVTVINRDGDSNVFMPLLQTAAPPITQEAEPNDTRQNATGSLTSGIAVAGGFSSAADERDYYYIDHGLGGDVTVTLSDIPTGHDYDLFLTLEDGTIIAESRIVGSANETITMSNLPASRYYILVFNFSESAGDQYQLVVDY